MSDRELRDQSQSEHFAPRPHEKLEVYQIAHALAVRVHVLTLSEYAVLCRKLFNYMQAVEKEHDPKRRTGDDG
jgi:hypothetical protein